MSDGTQDEILNCWCGALIRRGDQIEHERDNPGHQRITELGAECDRLKALAFEFKDRVYAAEGERDRVKAEKEALWESDMHLIAELEQQLADAKEANQELIEAIAVIRRPKAELEQQLKAAQEELQTIKNGRDVTVSDSANLNRKTNATRPE